MAISLLGLPREIRDGIYCFVFNSNSYGNNTVRVWTLDAPPQYTASGRHVDARARFCVGLFNLLLVNHQLHDEAEHVFFQTRLFWGDSDALLIFVNTLGHRRNLLQKMDLYVNDVFWLTQPEVESNKLLLNALSLISGLQVFRIQLMEDQSSQKAVEELKQWAVGKLTMCELQINNIDFVTCFESSEVEAAKISMEFSKTWKRIKGHSEWIEGESHCKIIARASVDSRGNFETLLHTRSELCNHSHLRV